MLKVWLHVVASHNAWIDSCLDLYFLYQSYLVRMQQIIWNIQVLQKKHLKWVHKVSLLTYPTSQLYQMLECCPNCITSIIRSINQVHLYWWLALHIDGLGWTAFDQISLSICEVCLPNLEEFVSSPHLAKSAAIYNSLPITMFWHHWKMKCE